MGGSQLARISVLHPGRSPLGWMLASMPLEIVGPPTVRPAEREARLHQHCNSTTTMYLVARLFPCPGRQAHPLLVRTCEQCGFAVRHCGFLCCERRRTGQEFDPAAAQTIPGRA